MPKTPLRVVVRDDLATRATERVVQRFVDLYAASPDLAVEVLDLASGEGPAAAIKTLIRLASEGMEIDWLTGRI